MLSRSFDTYIEACAFARTVAKDKVKHTLKRVGDIYVVEFDDTYKLQEVSEVMENSPPNIPSIQPSIEDARIELVKIITAAWTGSEPLYFQRNYVPPCYKVKLDLYFHDNKLGIVVRNGSGSFNQELIEDVEQELLLESSLGISYLSFSVVEIFGSRSAFIKKLKKHWDAANTEAKKPYSKHTPDSNSRVKPTPKTSVRHKPKSKHKAPAAECFKGGWTSLTQGTKRMGDATYEKRKAEENIGGTREQSIRMRCRGGS